MGRNKQISLFDENETIWEIKKHSSIVQMWNITTKQERKTMNALIWIAKDILKRNSDERVFRCDIGMIKSLCGFTDTNNIDLKNALRTLADTKIEYNIFDKDSREWGIFSFLASARIKEQGRWKPTFVTFDFPAMVLEVIKHPNMFVKLNLLIVRWLDSKHSIALYEFLKDYIRLGKLRCRIEDLRKMMGIQSHQYKSFTMIHKRVIQVAVEEINIKTDIEVSYEIEKEGRRVVNINFKMRPKNKQAIGFEQSDEIKKQLLNFKVKEEKVNELLQKHDEQYLRANIEIVKEQMKKWKVKNPTGYLLKAFDNAYSESQIESEKIQAQEIAKKEKQLDDLKVIKKQEKDLVLAFEIEKTRKIKKALEDMEQSSIEIYKNEFEGILLEDKDSFFAKMYLNKGFDHTIIQSKRFKFLGKKLLAKNDNDFEKFKAKKIKTKKSATL